MRIWQSCNCNLEVIHDSHLLSFNPSLKPTFLKPRDIWHMCFHFPFMRLRLSAKCMRNTSVISKHLSFVVLTFVIRHAKWLFILCNPQILHCVDTKIKQFEFFPSRILKVSTTSHIFSHMITCSRRLESNCSCWSINFLPWYIWHTLYQVSNGGTWHFEFWQLRWTETGESTIRECPLSLTIHINPFKVSNHSLMTV